MQAAILVVTTLLLGALLRALGVLQASDARGIDIWVLYVALPAIVLRVVPQISPDPNLLLPAAAPWIVALLTWATLGALLHNLGVDRAKAGALLLTTMLGNTAFVGLAAVQALRGPEALGAAVVADQLGTFLVMSTLGLWIAASASAGPSPTLRSILWKLCTFPPFLALWAAIGVGAAQIVWPSALEALLHALGTTLVPLALFSVGLRLRLRALHGQGLLLGLGLTQRLVVGPAVIALIAWCLGAQPATSDVAVLQAAMPPMVTASVLAAEYDLDAELAALMVSVGLVASAISLPAWSTLLFAIHG